MHIDTHYMLGTLTRAGISHEDALALRRLNPFFFRASVLTRGLAVYA